MQNLKSQNAIPAILIPCFNSGKNVLKIIDQCRTYSNLIVAINDGSTDDTLIYLNDSNIVTLSWKENRGKATALREGFQFLMKQQDWDIVFTIDSDGQHNPEEIPQFIQRYKDTNAEMIIGRRRFDRSNTPPSRYWANLISSKLISIIIGCKLHDIQCGYRMFHRSVVETFLPLLSSTKFAIETEMVLLANKMKIKIEEVEIESIYTNESTNRSTWKPFLDSWNIANVVTKYIIKK